MESAIDRIGDPWGSRVPHGRHQEWPARVDTFLSEGVEKNLSPQILNSL
ncbi:hypothetical protein [[Kitasatospora] papulosa]